MKKYPKSQKLANIIGIVAALLITSLLYLRLGRDYLFDWDEGIYAQLGLEMLNTGDIFTPTWGGEAWLEKPPGIAWFSAIGIEIFGKSSFGARSTMPLFAFISLLFLFHIGKKIKDAKTGLIAVFMLVYFDLFLSRSRGVNTDGPLLSTMLASIYLSLSFAHPAIIALTIFAGIWMKGLAGLLTLIVIAPIFVKRINQYAKVVAFSILYAMPWHLYQYLVQGEKFLLPYLKEQVVQRITTPIEYHIGNRWYYLKYLYENLDVGVIFLALLGSILLLYKFAKQKKKDLSTLLPIWWAGIILVVFTLAKTKLFWYILPALPAIALLVAYGISSLAVSKKAQQVLSILIFAMAIQSSIKVIRSVEYDKVNVPVPEKIQVATYLKENDLIQRVIVFVPQIERVFFEIMPEDQRISSSFRYGGMPSLLFYLEKPVHFSYTKSDMTTRWDNAERHPYGVFTQADRKEVPPFSEILFETKDYLVAKRGDIYVAIRDSKRSKARQLKNIQ